MENRRTNKRASSAKNKGNARNNRNIKNSRNTKQKRKMKRWKKILLILFLIILIAGGVFAYRVYKNGWGLSGMLATVVGHDEETKKNLSEFKCLVLGISTDEQGALPIQGKTLKGQLHMKKSIQYIVENKTHKTY